MPTEVVIAMSVKFKSNTTPNHFATTILELSKFILGGTGTFNSTTFSDIVIEKRAGK